MGRLATGSVPLTSAASETGELVTVCVPPAKCAIPAPGEDATTVLAATTPESAGMFAAPKLTRCPEVPAKAMLLSFVQVIAFDPLVVQSPLNSAAVSAEELPRIRPVRVDVLPVPPWLTGSADDR